MKEKLMNIKDRIVELAKKVWEALKTHSLVIAVAAYLGKLPKSFLRLFH